MAALAVVIAFYPINVWALFDLWRHRPVDDSPTPWFGAVAVTVWSVAIGVLAVSAFARLRSSRVSP